MTVSVKAINTNNENAFKYAPAVTGVSTFYSEFGTYKLANITFTGAPGYSYSLSFLSDGIDYDKPENKKQIE